jgi:predicted permease
MSTLVRDVRYALRVLRRSPLFTGVAILSLALGIGANAAIFTLIDQLILQELPVRDPEQLVLLTARGKHYGSNNGPNALSYPMYQDFRDKNQVFSGMFARRGTEFSLGVEGRTELASGEFVSGNYFPVLGVGAALGRVFTASDDLIQGAHPIAVLSYRYWKNRFNGDPGVLNRKIVIDGRAFTIVGVSAATFDGIAPGYSPEIRIPMTMNDAFNEDYKQLNERRRRFIQVFGRLKPGYTIDQAKAGLQPLFHQIIGMEVKMPAFAKASSYSRAEFLKMWMDTLPASKGRSQLREQFQKPLLALMAIVALVLLIACSNLANLLIARASSRQKEIALRLALGAGRGQLVRQLLVESVLLSALGGVAGLALAIFIAKALISFLPAGNTPLTLSGTPDSTVLAFTALISVLTGFIFGLIPALQATRPELAPTLKDQATNVVGGTAVLLRKMLVIAQVALSLLLLIGAGLFIQSLSNLKDLKPGFQTENVLSFQVDPTLTGAKASVVNTYYRQVLERLRAIPGVASAGTAVITLLDGNEWDNWVTIEGYTARADERPDPHMQYISTDFFPTLGIPILRGREFTARDTAGAQKVAIVNAQFVKKYFGASDPIGRHIGMGNDPGTKTDIEIIGVAGNTKYEDMRTAIPEEVYQPQVQQEFALNATVYVKTRGNPADMFATIRQAVRQVDPSVPVYRMRTLSDQVDTSLVTERLMALLSAVFGGLATVLAAMGLYGVMAYVVARRTREIGIRMALGANRGAVVWLVMRDVLLLSAIGVAIGLSSAWGLTRLVESQLFDVKPSDPATLLLATVGIAAVAMLAGYVPARRATGIDPTRALRFE